MTGIKFKVDEADIIDALDVKLDEIADQIFAESQNNIVLKNIIDEGTLLKSGKIIKQESERIIVYDVPYADVIEFGRTPGSMPPINPIKEVIMTTQEKQIRKN